MDKVAIYAGTSNVYPQIYTSLKSLLLNNQMDRVYLLIDTDEFPYRTPDCVILINASNQIFFPDDSANCVNAWQYMDMLRCALGFILPSTEKNVLWLDIDTIIDGDISELFKIDMDGYYFAGVTEFYKSTNFFRYINVGVCMHNLELLRKNSKEVELISLLNDVRLEFPGQDAINLLCQGRIKTIDSEFNKNMCSLPSNRPKIIHYAAIKSDKYVKEYAYRKYEQMELNV